ncbi:MULTISPECIES: N-acetyltransferase [unclassified Corallococcus]|uniref:N-acetyltransferase n=1 Tax=unclassified Corallococcus TaxID=2685029 RepID=UPI001CBA9DCE|nr:MULTISPECIES: N-acetyltransferase [unclassified Corallococcus]MBZ4329613.1 N-acetyltransferase [Corallococcus sp. AS-1-12]MBZ4373995.1 N-acetyltransferase [Corallococcus sp. AS-1-6]
MAHPAPHEASSPPSMPSDVQVTPVRGAADRTAFIRLPYSLYRDDPNWVPPLEMERRDFLDPKKNPFFDYAEVELFLARRGQDVVGRVAAIKNPRHMEFHGTKEGFFGLFECVNDAGVARGLLDAASAWLKARGIDTVLGPANFSSNQDWGLLVEGHESPPALMMPYNPAYYAGLLETCGFTKAKDLWAWELSSSTPPPEKVARIAEKIRQREGVTVRAVNLKDFPAEVARIKEIYNAAWEKNWGFIPFTDREFDHMAKEMKAIVRPELLLIAEVKGEPVAFSMTLPDANAAFKAANGRLTTFGLPIGLVKLVLASRKLKRLRLLTLGIKEGYRRRGLDAILYLDTLRTAKELGYTGGEISWTLEDNHLVNRAIESMGGKRSKTYRVYQRPV